MGDRGGVVEESAGCECMGATRGSVGVSCADDVQGMSVVRGVRGVCGLCEMYMCFGQGGVGGNWVG